MSTPPFDILETIASFYIEQPCTYKGWAQSGCVFLCLRKWSEGQTARLKKAMFQMVYGRDWIRNQYVENRQYQYIFAKKCLIPPFVVNPIGTSLYPNDFKIHASTLDSPMFNCIHLIWYRRASDGIHIHTQTYCPEHKQMHSLHRHVHDKVMYACSKCIQHSRNFVKD